MSTITADQRVSKAVRERSDLFRKLLKWGGFGAGAVLVAFGVVAIVMGFSGRATVANSLKLEKIVGSADMTPALIAKEAKDAGIIHNFIENYVPQVWKRTNPITQRMMADVQRGALDPSFKFSKQRVFESYFEGEQAGYKPATKDVGDLFAVWNQAMRRAIASREFIRDLHNREMPDGRPIAEFSGSDGHENPHGRRHRDERRDW
jgi:hypothetical protein